MKRKDPTPAEDFGEFLSTFKLDPNKIPASLRPFAEPYLRREWEDTHQAPKALPPSSTRPWTDPVAECERVEAYIAAATYGPWDHINYTGGMVTIRDASYGLYGSVAHPLAECHGKDALANKQFIAQARSDLPDALATIRKLHADNRKLHADVVRLRRQVAK